jgi:hypothetical protein
MRKRHGGGGAQRRRGDGPDDPGRKIERSLALLAPELARCMECGRSYRDRDRTYIGYAADHQPMVVGECCKGRLLSMIGVMIHIAPDGTPPWQVYERMRHQHADHCMGCGRPYQDQDPAFIGYAADNKPMMVGKCCSQRVASLIGVAVYMACATPPYFATDGTLPWQWEDDPDDATWLARLTRQ